MTGARVVVAVVVLGAALASTGTAYAQQTHHRQTRKTVVDGRAITVHPGESFLTGGTAASVGSRNGYVYDTLTPPSRNTIQGTFVGQRGTDRLPNQYSLPGSNEPLFTF
jgi:hypothetical protein